MKKRKLKLKRYYLKILYWIFRSHNFSLKILDLILRILNKKDSLLDISIDTNTFIIDSLHQDIKHLKKKLKVHGKKK